MKAEQNLLRFLLGLTRMGGIRNECRSEGTAQAEQFRAKVRYKAEVVWMCAEEGWCTYWKMLNVEGEI